ncbi:hypothetical protein [Ammoniphilus sp. YIM 78166]|uniref:hypothetical protein n=1 Tax=Ammoniphilus sp. YIM 78166 TaxID=1644106 RepID=UPI001431DA2E|nr:hypothetical protein [Ammoniphilus sp. YIM 78166]
MKKPYEQPYVMIHEAIRFETSMSCSNCYTPDPGTGSWLDPITYPIGDDSKKGGKGKGK